MAIQTYQIRLKDYNGAPATTFTGYGRGAGQSALRSFSYTRRVRTLGTFNFLIDGTDSRIPTLKNINYQVEFWRRDPLAGLAWLSGLPSWRVDDRTLITGWYKDFEGFIRGYKSGFDQDGARFFYVQGRQYNDLLAGETVNYPLGTTQATKSGLPGAVAAEYVNENIGAGAGLDQLGDSRVRTGLIESVESDTANVWDGNQSNENLMDVVMELAEFAPADYMIVGTGPATFTFVWRGTRWGLDRTLGNTGGLPPMVFSAKNYNTQSLETGYSALDEYNAVYTGGQGQGAARTYVTRSTAQATAFNWSRRAFFRDARNISDVKALGDRGDVELYKTRARTYAKFEARQTESTRYGRNWDLGDLLQFADEEASLFSMKCWGVKVRVDSNGRETITPELSEE